jgi:hypothetical protein
MQIKPHAHLLAPLQSFNESLGFTVSFEAIPGQAGGWCDQSARRIVVDVDQPARRDGLRVPNMSQVIAGRLPRSVRGGGGVLEDRCGDLVRGR